MMEKFSLNDTQDGLQPVENQLPSEFLKTFADKYHFKKSSTPGNAPAGNAPMNSGANAAFETAKKSGDVMAMLNTAPKANF